jgi:hypothetical protein
MAVEKRSRSRRELLTPVLIDKSDLPSAERYLKLKWHAAMV